VPCHYSEVGRLNCCWPSSAQSVLVSVSVGTHDYEYVFVFPNAYTCFEMFPPLQGGTGNFSIGVTRAIDTNHFGKFAADLASTVILGSFHVPRDSDHILLPYSSGISLA
jgi:hypothetical protein